MLSIDSAEIAKQLGYVIIHWKNKFHELLTGKMMAADISEDHKQFLADSIIFSMENVSVEELILLHQTGDIDRINERVSDVVDKFIPKLTGETLDFLKELYYKPQ